MAIPLLRSRAHWHSLVLGGIPVDFQVVLLALLVERFVHLVHDNLVGPALERDHLAEVIKAFKFAVVVRCSFVTRWRRITYRGLDIV